MGVFRSVKDELGLCQIRKVGSESWRFWFTSPYARWIASLKYFWYLGVKVLNLGVFEWGVSMAVMFNCFIVQNQPHSSELLVDCDMVFFGITFLYPLHVVYLLCDFDVFFFLATLESKLLPTRSHTPVPNSYPPAHTPMYRTGWATAWGQWTKLFWRGEMCYGVHCGEILLNSTRYPGSWFPFSKKMKVGSNATSTSYSWLHGQVGDPGSPSDGGLLRDVLLYKYHFHWAG